MQVKKKQQRALMILQSIKVPFKSIDITEPGQEEARDFMREHCKKTDAGGCTPPPHFFSGNDYLGVRGGTHNAWLAPTSAAIVKDFADVFLTTELVFLGKNKCEWSSVWCDVLMYEPHIIGLL